MTAVENVMVGVHCRTSGGFLAAIAQHPWKLSAGERETIRGADGLLDLVGLAGKRDVAADEPRSSSSAGSRSPGRWRAGRACSCSTSRRRG